MTTLQMVISLAATDQLDVEVISNVDLNELRQPHVVRHESKSLSQPLLETIGEVSDTPPVQWLRFVAVN